MPFRAGPRWYMEIMEIKLGFGRLHPTYWKITTVGYSGIEIQ